MLLPYVLNQMQNAVKMQLTRLNTNLTSGYLCRIINFHNNGLIKIFAMNSLAIKTDFFT